MRNTISHLCLPFAAIILTGCNLERLFPQEVGEGTARLSVRNAGAITLLVSEDANCGFASDSVNESVVLHGQPGEMGYAEWTVEDCHIQLQENTQISKPDCHGEGEMLAQGSLEVSAKRRVRGMLTGDAANPVLPLESDAVQMTFDVSFSDFAVRAANDPNALTMNRGQLSFTARPTMAESALAPGVCAAVTPNILFNNIVYSDATLYVESAQQDFEVEVPTSHFAAVNGERNEGENAIVGRIQVWDSDRAIEGPLNPDYDPSKFVTSFAEPSCILENTENNPDVHYPLLPINLTCGGVDNLLVPGAARLSLKNISVIASLIEEDENCGFSSDSVLNNFDEIETSGPKGKAIYEVSACELNFPVETVVSQDCQGVETTVKGRVVVSARKTLEGLLSHNSAQPVVPLTDTPATIELTQIHVDEFHVSSNDRVESLVFRSGTVSGTIKPRTAMDTENGVCSVPTANALFDHIRLQDLQLELKTELGGFTVPVESGQLQAVAGSFAGQTNTFHGQLVVRGQTFELPLEDDEGFIPDFDLNTYDSSWACADELARPISYECDVEPRILSGAPRLSIGHFGNVIDMLEKDENCGFSSQDVLDNVVVNGELGMNGGEAVYQVEGCLLSFPNETLVSEDCNGNQTWIKGQVLVSAQKTLSGIVSGDDDEPIVPTSWNPATITASMHFEGLEVRMDNQENYLVIEKGTLSGSLTPRTAIDTTNGACALPTAAIAFDNLRFSNGEMKIYQDDSWIQVNIDESDFSAQNGMANGRENYLSGRITVGGVNYDVPFDTAEPILNPDYDRSDFLATFACKENMELPFSNEDCSFNKVLGEGAARLLIQAMGEAASMINEDSGCGFSKLSVMMDSTKSPSNAEAGDMGSLTFSVDDCEMAVDPEEEEEAVAEDCLGKEKFREGSVTVSSTRVVEGELEDITIPLLGIKIADSIIPTTSESVSVDLESVTFNEFLMYGRGPNGEEDMGELKIHSGTGNGLVEPILGEQEDTPGSYMVPTPIARLSDIQVANIEATLYSDGKTFRLQISEALLDAFNGSYGGSENEISGHIIVNGEYVLIEDPVLNPDFDQSQFDASYECTDNLMELISSSSSSY